MSNISILVVEDSDNDYFLLERSIHNLTHLDIMHRVLNGKEALAYLSSASPLPQLILMDINMPVMDGHTCLQEIRKVDRWKHIPIIIFSTTDDQPAVLSSFFYHAAGHVVKPDTLDKYIDFMSNIEKYWATTTKLPEIESS